MSTSSTFSANGLAVSAESKWIGANGNADDLIEQLAPNGTYTSAIDTVTSATGLITTIYTNMQDSLNVNPTASYSTQVSTTTLNADGSKTIAYTEYRGLNTHDSHKQVISNGGLLSTTTYDLNGDGSYTDLTTVDQTVLGSFAMSLNPTAPGVKQRTITDSLANGAIRDQSITTSDSVGDQWITRNLGINGLGNLDQKESVLTTTATSGSVVSGSRVDTIYDLESNGSTAYETKTTTTSSDGLSTLTQFTFNAYDPVVPGTTQDIPYSAAMNYALSDVVTLPQSGANAGARVDTFTESFGSLVTETVVTTTSANGLTTTISASGSVTSDTIVTTNTTEQKTLNYDAVGGVSDRTTVTNQNVGQWGDLNATSTDTDLVTTSASGLTTVTKLDVDGLGVWDVTDTVAYGDSGASAGDGAKRETLVVLNPLTHAQRERDLTLTSADGRTRTLRRESNGNTAFDDHIEQSVTNSDGSVTDTITDYASAAVKAEIFKQTASADGLVSSLTIDTNADGSADYGRSSSTLLNANGTEVLTQMQTVGASGLTWNKTVTTTSVTGWSKTSNIYLNGDASADESEDDNIVLNSDGSTTETDLVKYLATGSVKSEILTTVSANGRLTISTVYLNGTASNNKVETKTSDITADGMTSQVNQYFLNGATTNESLSVAAPDQDYQGTRFWDGSRTETDFIPDRNGSYNWTYKDQYGDLLAVSTHTIDANNIDIWDYGTANASGGKASEYIVTLDVSTENKFEAMAARLYDTIFDRDMTSFEVQGLAKYIQNDNLNETSLADDLMNSAEFTGKYGTTSNAQYIEQLYENAVGRTASVSDMLGNLTALDNGTFNRAYLAFGISESTEHVLDGNVHAITNNTYVGGADNLLDHTTDTVTAKGVVARMFQTALGRAATTSELSTYGGDLATGSGLSATGGTAEWQVANLIAGGYGLSSTVSSSMVQTMYQNAFGAAPNSSDLSGWTTAASSGHLNTADLIMSLADSPQYFLYHHS